MRKTPVLLRRSGLTGTIYAITNYTPRDGGRHIRVSGNDGKHDVTQDFYRIAAEMWPILVERGDLKPVQASDLGEEQSS